jgi:S-adenosyl methyltransferase
VAARSLAADSPAQPCQLAAARAAKGAFIRRAVRVIARQGIWRFLAVGDCYPLVHETLGEFGSGYRIAYVSEDHLDAVDGTMIAVAGKPSDADLITDSSRVNDLLRDGDKPVGIIMTGVLERIAPLREARQYTWQLADWAPEGSFVAASHALSDTAAPVKSAAVAEDAALIFRTAQQISGLFSGLAMLPPGLVEVSRWRVNGCARRDPPALRRMGGVARKGQQRTGMRPAATISDPAAQEPRAMLLPGPHGSSRQ